MGHPRAVGASGRTSSASGSSYAACCAGETGPTGGPAMTDVLGVCESWEDGDRHRAPRGRQRRGDRHRRHRLRASRCRPGRRCTVGSTPRRPTGWRCPAGSRSRASRSASGCSAPRAASPPGATRCSRSATRGCPLPEAVARVAEWYAARSLPPRAPCPPGRAGGGRRSRRPAGRPTSRPCCCSPRWPRCCGSSVRTRSPSPDTTSAVDEGWLATDERAARTASSARAVLEAGEVTFATVRDEQGAVLARGRGAFHGDWVGVSALWTDPAHRGTGLSSAVLQSLLSWGAERGATTAYLQVVESNDHARRHLRGARVRGAPSLRLPRRRAAATQA